MIGLLWLMVVVVALVGGGTGFENILLPSLAITLLTAFAHLTGVGRLRRVLWTFLLVLTILTLLYIWNGWGGRYMDRIGDGGYYLESAREIIVHGYFSTPLGSIQVNNVGAPYLYAAVLILGMGNIYSLIVLHALIIVLYSIMMYKIAERLFDVRTAHLAYWMTALQPEVLAWSSILIRDSLVVLMIISFFYVCIRLFIDGSQHHIFSLLAILVATYFVRASMVFGFIAIALVYAASVILQPRRYLIATVASAAVVAIGIGLTMFHYTGDPRMSRIGTILVSGIEGRYLQPIEFANISIIRDLLGGRFTVINFYLWPLWVIAYWVFPFPKLLSGIYHANPMLTVVENSMGMVNFVLLPFILLGVLAIIKDSRINRLMLVAAAAIMATGMTLAGPFVVGRYRLIVTPFFILIAAYALTHMRMSQRVLVVALIPFTMVTFYVSYLLVKVLLS